MLWMYIEHGQCASTKDSQTIVLRFGVSDGTETLEKTAENKTEIEKERGAERKKRKRKSEREREIERSSGKERGETPNR